MQRMRGEGIVFDTTTIIIGILALLVIITIANFSFFRQEYDDLLEDLSAFATKIPGLAFVAERELYKKIFHKYKHSSVKQWLSWYKEQELNVQGLALRKMLKYLSKSPDELGAISKDVIIALQDIKPPDAYPVLASFMLLARKYWEKYIVIKLAYADCLAAMAAIEPGSSMRNFTDELKFYATEYAGKHLALDTREEIQLALLEALTDFDLNDELVNFYSSVILSPAFSLKVKRKILHLLADCDTQELEDFYVKVFDNLLILYELEHLEQKTVDQHRRLIALIFESLKAHEFNEMPKLWQVIVDGLNNKRLYYPLAAELSLILANKNIELDATKVIQLLELKDEDGVLMSALSTRFELSEDELCLIAEPDLAELYSFHKDIALIETHNDLTNKARDFDFPILESLQDHYEDFQKAIQNAVQEYRKDPGHIFGSLNLLSGQADEEKIYFLRSYAYHNGYSFVYLDASKLILSPDKFSSLLESMNKYYPAIVFFDNYDYVMEKLNHGKLKKREQDFIETCANMASKKYMAVFASTRLEYSYVKREFADYFQVGKIFELENFSLQERKRVFENYELMLRDSRNEDNVRFDALAATVEEMDSIAYISYLQKYFRASLLASGKLITFEDYNVLCASH